MDKTNQIAACQPKILSYKDSKYFEYAGASGGFIDILGYPFCRGRFFNNLEIDSSQYDDSIEIFWATGACLLVRSSIFGKLEVLIMIFLLIKKKLISVGDLRTNHTK